MIEITREEARAFLIEHLGLARASFPDGAEGVRAVLRALRCIQLDPLDPIGTNADLVVLARVDGISRGDVHRHLHPGHAFEHYAKERCLLPADAFPTYRDHALAWSKKSLQNWLKRVPPKVLTLVLAEIEARGPITPEALTQHGSIERIDWSGWKGTPFATKMAVEILAARCQIVVCGREGRSRKVYDVPRRALAHVADAKPERDFARFAIVERVRAAGLLGRNAGAHWSMLTDVRAGATPTELVDRGEIEAVTIEGHPRTFLAPKGFRSTEHGDFDDRMRIIAPLDPLIWDRPLVRHVFEFEYVWEVYKPQSDRRWGWYVCPLLHRGRLVGRLEARIEPGVLCVQRLWRERGARFDDDALDAALERHARACGVERVKRPRRPK